MNILFKSHHIQDQEYFLLSKKNKLLLWINEDSIEKYIKNKYPENWEEKLEILEYKLLDEKKIYFDMEFLEYYREFDVKKMVCEAHNHNNYDAFRFLETVYAQNIITENFPECRTYFKQIETQRKNYKKHTHHLFFEQQVGMTWTGNCYLIVRKECDQLIFEITIDQDIYENYYDLGLPWNEIPSYDDVNYNDELIRETINMPVDNIDWEKIKSLVESNFDIDGAFDQAKESFMEILKKKKIKCQTCTY